MNLTWTELAWEDYYPPFRPSDTFPLVGEGRLAQLQNKNPLQ